MTLMMSVLISPVLFFHLLQLLPILINFSYLLPSLYNALSLSSSGPRIINIYPFSPTAPGTPSSDPKRGILPQLPSQCTKWNTEAHFLHPWEVHNGYHRWVVLLLLRS